MPDKKLSVETPLGKLCAAIGNDPENYPEIYIYIEREDGQEIDLVATEVNLDKNAAVAYLYGNTSTDEWTKSHTWSAEEIGIQDE